MENLMCLLVFKCRRWCIWQDLVMNIAVKLQRRTIDMENSKGYIYILTNPSFPEYVKIGYADDIKTRLAQLNRSECTPFAFRVYATYDVDTRLTDMKLHAMIDKLNPTLRAVDNVDGKKTSEGILCHER